MTILVTVSRGMYFDLHWLFITNILFSAPSPFLGMPTLQPLPWLQQNVSVSESPNVGYWELSNHTSMELGRGYKTWLKRWEDTQPPELSAAVANLSSAPKCCSSKGFWAITGFWAMPTQCRAITICAVYAMCFALVGYQLTSCGLLLLIIHSAFCVNNLPPISVLFTSCLVWLSTSLELHFVPCVFSNILFPHWLV